jgi:uncharacterized protein YndB with AHSA1/START domain
MTDIRSQIDATTRRVGSPESGTHQVVLSRRYQAPVADVWEACTSPERIARWFLPVTGDFRPGGSYQLDGNAGGTIVQCEPPHLLKLTWVFGDTPPSEVELRLSASGDDTLLELEHAGLADDALWAQFGPGAVGTGWDLALLGLGLHLSGEERPADPEAWMKSPEGTEFVVRSAAAWGKAFEAAGAGAAEAEAVTRQVTAFYAPHTAAEHGTPG